jgi:c-di-GMP-binding flagellar brake protein YcgR
VRFTTTENLEMNSLLYAHINLPSGELQAPVRVCRSEKIDDSKKYSISVEFHDLSERDRDRIVRCVFDLQRAMRKKGLV